MKTRSFQTPPMTLVVLTALGLAAGNVVAQDSTTATTELASTAASTSTAPQASADQPAPQLSYGVSEVVQLSRANVGENVIVSYIQNSGNNYGLNASQIIYLRHQGVSDNVINTMLNQRTQSAQTVSTAPAATTESAPASSAQTSTTTTQPAVAYVPATPAATVYVVPDTQTYNYNAWLYSRPYYAYYPYCYGWPAVSLSVGFGFGGYYGGGYHNHGGYYGGGHNNGWHGGGNGWHGGNGGWHH